MLWDVFISHASEDASTAGTLKDELERIGLRVWLDKDQLEVGDSLRGKIDRGLSLSRYGVVILSPAFFDKPWTENELDGLSAREAQGRKVILPVWHGVDDAYISRRSPLLANRVAARTRDGLKQVAKQIAAVAGRHLDRTQSGGRGYAGSFEIPGETVARAVGAIEALGAPASTAELSVTNEDYPYGAWLGTDSPFLIATLYRLMAPLIEFDRIRYRLRRSVSVMDGRDRTRMCLLEAALNALCNEHELARLAPAIPYDPRQPDFREKRMTDPQRYWWQGCEAEWFQRAVPYFLDDGEGEMRQLKELDEFRRTYCALYRSGSRTDQQPMGILANPLFGFSVRERPVYWRLLVMQARLYSVLMGNTVVDLALARPQDAELLFKPAQGDRFPFTGQPADAFEPAQVTRSVVEVYLQTFVVPRLRLILDAPRESA